MTKKVPKFRTDEEAEAFLEQDLTDYLDLGQFERTSLEFLPETEQVNLRFSAPLLAAVRAESQTGRYLLSRIHPAGRRGIFGSKAHPASQLARVAGDNLTSFIETCYVTGYDMIDDQNDKTPGLETAV